MVLFYGIYKLGERREELSMYQHGGDIYRNKNIIDFSVNVNPCGIPESVVEAATLGAKLAYQYPDTDCTELKVAISTASDLPIEYLLCGNGAAELIISIVLAIRPKKALLPIPSFHEYEQALGILDCEITYAPLLEENGFRLQKEFLNEITSDMDVLFLCNPNNPTGELVDTELIDQILDRCEKQNVLLVVDECFMEFVKDYQPYSLKSKCLTSNHLIILKAFTKLYAMPGLRLGYVICKNKELLHRMREVTQPWSVSVPAQLAGIAALQDEAYKTRSLLLLAQEKVAMLNQLQQLGFKLFGSRANYIFFQSSIGLYEFCLKRGVLIRDCSNYKGLREGFYRIAVRQQKDNQVLLGILKEWQKWQNRL